MNIQKLGVIGSGTMGSGIAQAAAVSGIPVTLCDSDQSQLERAHATIAKSLDRLVAKDKLSAADKDAALGLVHATTELQELQTVDLMIEAITENVDAKLALLDKLQPLCQPHTIIASNTSSLSLTKLAAATDRADRVIGMHFFNPVPVMRLVEIIRALQTSDDTYQRIADLTRKLGKEPVSVKDSPGFVVNRMLVPMINEAAFIRYEGLASAEEIDAAMKLGANHPIGPLALADMIGIDVCLFVIEILHREFGDSKYRACPLLKQMVEAGYLGRKAGKGFYDYP